MSPRKRRKRRLKTKKYYHVILILFLIAAGIFFFYDELEKEDIPKTIVNLFKPLRKPDMRPEIIPGIPHVVLPEVAIVIDDLGSNKKTAMAVLNIEAPLTLSIIPHEVYTKWIAEEGHMLGHEIIAHIPMEAQTPHKLGKGGLYTWMTDNEISEILDRDIRAVPYIKGFGNHMGSAFTEDERVMRIVISAAKKRRLFFLDSLTTAKSVAVKVAKEQGINILQRDIFLDVKDNPAYIEAQWKKLVKIAQKRGYAIVLAHPKKNTIEFLKNTLKDNEITVVPLSELTQKMHLESL